MKFALVLLCSVFAVPFAAFAQTDLPDFVSKAELAQEFSSFPNEPLAFMSPRTNRLQITIHKALVNETMVIVLDGQTLYTWPTSTGSERWEDTPSGSHEFTETPNGEFRIFKMVKDYVSETWRAPMPNAMFFNEGIAIHETSHVDQLGSPASGGCVRLDKEHAQLLWDLVAKTGTRNTIVIVTPN